MMRSLFIRTLFCGVALLGSFSTDLSAQEKDIAALAEEMERRLDESLAKYRSLQESIAAEKVPIIDRINELENQAIEMRANLRAFDLREERELEDLKGKQLLSRYLRTQNDYVSGLFAQYLNTFESRLHVAEDQLYSERLTPYREAIELAGPGTQAAREKRTEAVELSLDRLDNLLGGYSFEGKSVDPTGEILNGEIVVFGPVAFFRDDSAASFGVLTLRPGTLEPALTALDGEFASALENYGASNSYSLPLDASLGKAISLKNASGNWRDHLEQGGPVGYAILGMGALALFLALVKLVDFSALAVSIPPNLASIARNAVTDDLEKANAEISGCKTWMRDMLGEGASHVREDRDLMEDHMISVILRQKPRLERFLPWLAVTAAATPLMGLLGTVVGMIKTFTLITIFGSGDPKALSSGISEALVTTELGLVVAIPTLIVHGALLRLAKKRINAMELAATEFSKIVNKLSAQSEG